jgi:hypothetical protein
MNLRRLIGAALASAAISACSATGSGLLPGPAGDSASSVHASAPAAYAFAPYVDMTAYPPFKFAEGSKQTGTKYFTMAFIVSHNDTACQGAWGGLELPNDPTAGPYLRKQVTAIRALGGDAILAFGGAGHKELAQVCPDAASLEAAYEADIDYYKISHVDFDIEGPAVDDTASVERRSQALVAMSAHYAKLGKPLTISYTLAVDPFGMPGDVLAVVQSAVNANLKIAIVNLMAMDFGDSAPHPQGRMAAYAIESLHNAEKQLQKIGFPFGANPYASIGVTPMIGLNDDHNDIFEPADAQTLLAWAQGNGLGRISFWAAQRDKECKGGVKTYASDTCSSIIQTPGQFSKIFAAY